VKGNLNATAYIDIIGDESWPKPIKHLCDELERRLRARPNRPTLVPNLTNALVAEWIQVPVAMFQHLVESLPWRVEAVIAEKGPQLYINVHDFGMRCIFDKQVSTYFLLCSVSYLHWQKSWQNV
jgi:hypothetical protein